MTIELEGGVNDEGRAVVNLTFGLEMTPAEVADFSAHLKNALIQASVAVGEKAKACGCHVPGSIPEACEAVPRLCALPLPPALPEVVDAASPQDETGSSARDIFDTLKGCGCGFGD